MISNNEKLRRELQIEIYQEKIDDFTGEKMNIFRAYKNLYDGIPSLKKKNRVFIGV